MGELLRSVMKIAFDLDDILSSFNQIFVDYHNRHYGTNLTFDDINDFYPPNVYMASEQECLRRIFEFYRTTDCDNLPVESGANELIDDLIKKGHELYVITARDPEISEHTLAWLKKNFDGKFKDVIMTKQFSQELGVNNHYKKSDACKKYGIEVLVEDAIHNAEDVAKEGIKAILITKPWNKKYKPTDPNIIRASNLNEIMRLRIL